MEELQPAVKHLEDCKSLLDSISRAVSDDELIDTDRKKDILLATELCQRKIDTATAMIEAELPIPA